MVAGLSKESSEAHLAYELASNLAKQDGLNPEELIYNDTGMAVRVWEEYIPKAKTLLGIEN